MLSSVSVMTLNELIEARHSNPHDILGLHAVKLADGSEALSVRVFVPNGKSVVIIDADDETYEAALERVHVDGLFEKRLDRRERFSYRLRISDYEGNTWECYDPYAFPPVLTELDFHLFAEGTHYRIYEKLGAHSMTVDGVEGVHMAVWAPNAHRVSVIGGFNNWDGRRHPMRLLSCGLWELFIPGLKDFDSYKFEILTHCGSLFQKSDPFANFSELRPSTSSLVFDIDRHNWRDAKWRARKKGADPVNIYELHLGSWKRRAEDKGFLSYTGLADELIPYVKEMGYTHVQLLPVMEHSRDDSGGYQTTGYYSPTSRYGTPEELMEFIDGCHEKGVGVILDWVPSYFPKDEHGLIRFDGSALYEHENWMQAERGGRDALTFNYGRNEVKNFLISNALYWLDKFHADGLRFGDLAAMLYLDYGKRYGGWIPNRYGGREDLDAIEFIRQLKEVVSEYFPSALIFAEDNASWNSVTDKLTPGIMHKHISAGTDDKKSTGKISGACPKCANLRIALVFMYGQPGKKLLFMGGELGLIDGFGEAGQLDWELAQTEHHTAMRRFTKKLSKLYLREKALWWNGGSDDSGFEWIDGGAQSGIIAFERKTQDGENALIIICNFTGDARRAYRVGVPFGGEYKVLLNTDDREFGGSGSPGSKKFKAEGLISNGRDNSLTINIAPMSALILKRL